MTDITEKGPSAGRAMRSARVLKAYFEHKLKISLELLTEAPAEPLSEGMQFDLQVGQWGIWGLRSSEKLSDKIQSEISASFHSLFTAIDSGEKRRHDLAVLQEQYEKVSGNLPGNVIPLFKPRKPTRPVYAKTRDSRWALKQDCLIESSSLSDIHKMAMELHENSSRVGFVHHSDLSRETRLNLSEMIALGAVTVFVPNILALSWNEQEVLRQLLAAAADSSDRPLIMVGACRAYSDLRSEPAIHLEFLLLLSRAYIKLSRPFSEYKDQSLIKYFLDSLAQSPT